MKMAWRSLRRSLNSAFAWAMSLSMSSRGLSAIRVPCLIEIAMLSPFIEHHGIASVVMTNVFLTICGLDTKARTLLVEIGRDGADATDFLRGTDDGVDVVNIHHGELPLAVMLDPSERCFEPMNRRGIGCDARHAGTPFLQS